MSRTSHSADVRVSRSNNKQTEPNEADGGTTLCSSLVSNPQDPPLIQLLDVDESSLIGVPSLRTGTWGSTVQQQQQPHCHQNAELNNEAQEQRRDYRNQHGSSKLFSSSLTANMPSHAFTFAKPLAADEHWSEEEGKGGKKGKDETTARSTDRCTDAIMFFRDLQSKHPQAVQLQVPSYSCDGKSQERTAQASTLMMNHWGGDGGGSDAISITPRPPAARMSYRGPPHASELYRLQQEALLERVGGKDEPAKEVLCSAGIGMSVEDMVPRPETTTALTATQKGPEVASRLSEPSYASLEWEGVPFFTACWCAAGGNRRAPERGFTGSSDGCQRTLPPLQSTGDDVGGVAWRDGSSGGPVALMGSKRSSNSHNNASGHMNSVTVNDSVKPIRVSPQAEDDSCTSYPYNNNNASANTAPATVALGPAISKTTATSATNTVPPTTDSFVWASAEQFHYYHYDNNRSTTGVKRLCVPESIRLPPAMPPKHFHSICRTGNEDAQSHRSTVALSSSRSPVLPFSHDNLSVASSPAQLQQVRTQSTSECGYVRSSGGASDDMVMVAGAPLYTCHSTSVSNNTMSRNDSTSRGNMSWRTHSSGVTELTPFPPSTSPSLPSLSPVLGRTVPKLVSGGTMGCSASHGFPNEAKRSVNDFCAPSATVEHETQTHTPFPPESK